MLTSESNPVVEVRYIDDLSALATAINAAHKAGEKSTRSAFEHYRAAGDSLLKARKLCPHGTWLPWIKDNLQCSQPQAWRYMEFAKLCTVNNLDEQQAIWQQVCGRGEQEPREVSESVQGSLTELEGLSDEELCEKINESEAADEAIELDDKSPRKNKGRSRVETVQQICNRLIDEVEKRLNDLELDEAMRMLCKVVNAAIIGAERFSSEEAKIKFDRLMRDALEVLTEVAGEDLAEEAAGAVP